MPQVAQKKTPYWTMQVLLHRGGLTRKKFRKILLKARGWSEVENMASILCTGAVMLLLDDGKEISADCLAYEKGGCSSYLTIHRGMAMNGQWKRIYIPKETPTVEELLKFAERKRSEGKPVRLTRRQRQMFGKKKLAGQNITISGFLQGLRGTVAAA